MKPSKSPWYPWFPRDFAADEPVMLMSLEQEGAYRRLLDHQWLHGSIPADLGQLAVICKMLPAARMRSVWAGVSRCFEAVEGTDRMVNPRLERVRDTAEEHRERQRQNGSKGAQKRWQKDGDTNGDTISGATISPVAKNSSALPLPIPDNYTTTTAVADAVFGALPDDARDSLANLCRASTNPAGLIDDLARLMAVHPNVIPTGAGMRGESPDVVGVCLVELANSGRPTWNAAYFKGMLRKAKQRPPETPSGKAETPSQKILRMAAEQDAAA